MPRGPRADAPGSIHHLMLRGIERRRVFADTRDYEDFAERLARLIPELEFRCFAWVLMPNHVHLAVKTGPVPLSRLMARLGTGYARTFNRRHHRVGHLFQNRFKSRLVEGDRDLLGLVLYIHRNPIDSLLVPNIEALRRFPWCGHGALVGALPARPFESPSATLRLFAEDPALARQRLRRWMGDPAGESGAIEHWLDVASSIAKRSPAHVTTAGSLTDLIDDVCKAHRLDREALGPGRRASRVLAARAELSRRAIRELGLPSRAVARALGVSDSTISRALHSRERERWPRIVDDS